MISTRRVGRLSGEYMRWAPLGPGGDPQLSLQGRRLGAGASYGDYGDVVSLRGRGGLGEDIRWSRLGPGGDPMMSLQGTRLGRCGPGCGCGPCRGQGLAGLPTTMAEVDWSQLGLGAALGVAAYYVAKRKGWV